MPADFHIDANGGIVYSMATGVVTLADLLDHMDRLLRHPDFRPEFNQLFDFRPVTGSALLGDDVARLAERNVFSVTSRRAFVTSADWQFGYGRMFATLRSGTGETGIMVFRDMNEAVSWLGIPGEPDPRIFLRLRGPAERADGPGASSAEPKP